jgi:hypothetical protein
MLPEFSSGRITFHASSQRACGCANREKLLILARLRREIPVVREIGPRDLASNNIVLKRRDTAGKEVLPQAEAVVKEELATNQTRS